jgi:heterodisulfide reductase subunit C/quinone-modifying oxidoreductase subunit QmoC
MNSISKIENPIRAGNRSVDASRSAQLALRSALTDSNLAACLQCRKCTSGCPVSARVDVKPHELVRLVQLGLHDEALASRLVWECTSCQTCVTRCPQKVSIAALNDSLRRIGLTRGRGAICPTAVPTFNSIFLRIIRRLGRMHEMGLMTAFKLRTLRLFEDVTKFPMMLLKGKLPLLPKRVGGRAGRREFKQMFKRVAEFQTRGLKP